MQKRGQIPAILVSLTVNVTTLAVLHFFFHLPTQTLRELLAIDSINQPEERQRDEFVQKLDLKVKPAETYVENAGAISSKLGGRSQVIKSQAKVEPLPDSSLNVPTVNPGEQEVVSPNLLGEDLGESEVNGDAQVLVKGYGAALDRIALELIRMMRQDRLLVVWLFDESESMKDDQLKIKQRFGRIYKELQIVDREAERIGISKRLRRKYGRKKSLLSEIMLTTIASFGKQYHQQTKTPTSDINEVLSAIGKIPVDRTGSENMCAAILEAIGRHKVRKARDKRKLVLIVVSDESGDDGAAIETAIRSAKSVKAPVYVLGREAVFGSRFAYVRWTQRETGRRFNLPVRRGPETPLPELLQYDGFRRRYDSHMSGFGPYDQCRLCRDTGGIFFQLPHEDTDLNDFDNRVYVAHAMRAYMPSLLSRSEYVVERDRSDFRKAIWEVIVMLDPAGPNRRNIPELPDPALRAQSFSTEPGSFVAQTRQRGTQIRNIIALINRAITRMEKVKPLRAKEPSVRWRANYDLIRAQLYWYQLRLFEYGIAMDQFVRKGLRERLTRNPKHNRWQLYETGRKLVLPDELNAKRFKVSPEELKEKYRRALARFAELQQEHPDTPWARRAEWESKRPFGVAFRTYYQPPPPKPPPNTPRRPKPTPPPKL